MRGLLAIDPGLGSTGWAYWPRYDDKIIGPKYFGLLRNDCVGVWWTRAFHQGVSLLEEIPAKKDMEVICEMPIFFASGAVGHAAASTDSLQKLCFLVGVFGEAIRHGTLRTRFSPVYVRDWKGQLPKEIVELRIKHLLGASACVGFKLDIWDAVGIGLHAKGVII